MRKRIQTLAILILSGAMLVTSTALANAPVNTSRMYVERVRANTWVVKRDQVEVLTTKPGREALWNEVVLRRSKVNGQQRGYRLKTVKRGSLAMRLGLRSGDVLLEVKGVKLESDTKAWKAYRKSKDARTIKVVIQRGSRRLTHYYVVAG